MPELALGWVRGFGSCVVHSGLAWMIILVLRKVLAGEGPETNGGDTAT